MEFDKTIDVPVSRARLWDWHAGPGTFARLAPPWQKMKLEALPESFVSGAEASFRLGMGPVWLRWKAVLDPVEAPERFVDTQITGPFAHWRHEHRMEVAGDGNSRLTDQVHFELPFGLGRLGPARRHALAELERLFTYRHALMREDLTRWPQTLPGQDKVILVTGMSGLIGRRLVPLLETLGYQVRGLTRGAGDGKRTFTWNPESGTLDGSALEGLYGVIHLAGENIASGWWTEARKRRILESRRQGTRLLVDQLRKQGQPPEVFVSASGVNIYAEGQPASTEEAPLGEGFLSDVCQVWEGEAARAAEAGIRTVCLRTGIVLDPAGGALGKMLPAFRAGMGGPIGSGKQAFPWISMDDLCDIYVRALTDSQLEGPVNAVHPQQLGQLEFARTLGQVLSRPAFLPLPAMLVRSLFGQMGRETLLADVPVRAARLEAQGHRYRHKSLNAALRHLLGKPSTA